MIASRLITGLVGPSSQPFAFPFATQVGSFAKALAIASARSPQRSGPATGEAETAMTPSVPPVFALHFVIATAAVLVVGWLLATAYVERLVRTNETAMLIGTLGLSYVILNSARLTWGNDAQEIEVPWAQSSVMLPGGSGVPVQYLFTAGVAIAATLALVWLVFRTRHGTHMRAVAENRYAAELCGIRVSRVYRMTFALGGAVAALAGTTAGAVTAVDFNIGQLVILKAFVVVIIAGLGSISGAIWAGLLLGLVETLGGGLISPAYQDAFGYVLMVVVLVLLPHGLMVRKAL